MENMQKLSNELDQLFNSLREIMVRSFKYIKANPQRRDEIISLWKNYIKKLLREATILSEKYKDKGIIKAVTKMFIFGR